MDGMVILVEGEAERTEWAVDAVQAIHITFALM